MKRRGKKSGVEVRLVSVGSRRLVELSDLSELGVVDVRDAIVKVAPVVPASRRADLNVAEVRRRVMAAGAVAVVVSPRVVADAVMVASSPVATAASTRGAISAWFAELRGISESDRSAASVLAESLADTEGA